MTTPLETRIALEEWKEHYASYREGRGQYLQWLSMFWGVLVVGLGVSLTAINDYVRALIFLALTGANLVAIGAHLTSFGTVGALESRFRTLEGQLGMPPETLRTRHFLQSLRITFAACLASLFGVVTVTVALIDRLCSSR
jgi:hypothetical protein